MKMRPSPPVSRSDSDEGGSSALLLLLLLVILTACRPVATPGQVQPGPETAGLRLRLQVTPLHHPATEQFRVQADLINTSPDTITLQAHQWRSMRREGGFPEFLEAALSIQSDPPIEPWLGQVAVGRSGPTPEPQHTLKPGQTLSVTWTNTGRTLKNTVTNPLDVQNPEFRENGLYSIHALLLLTANGQTAQLRSNDQLVPFGRTHTAPKHTYGQLWWADESNRTAILSLGSLHKTATGDRFLIHSGIIGMTWTLTITNVQPESSTGTLEPSREDPTPAFPGRGSHAALIHD